MCVSVGGDCTRMYGEKEKEMLLKVLLCRKEVVSIL